RRRLCDVDPRAAQIDLQLSDLRKTAFDVHRRAIFPRKLKHLFQRILNGSAKLVGTRRKFFAGKRKHGSLWTTAIVLTSSTDRTSTVAARLIRHRMRDHIFKPTGDARDLGRQLIGAEAFALGFFAEG